MRFTSTKLENLLINIEAVERKKYCSIDLMAKKKIYTTNKYKEKKKLFLFSEIDRFPFFLCKYSLI